MHPPTLRQLNCLLAAVSTGSLSAAGRLLQITQPAASQQVKELERALGVRLLQRGGGPVRPTAAGDAILAQARQVQTAVDALMTVAASFQDGGAGRLRLGTGATACVNLLPPALARIRQRMPGLEIIIATGNTGDMLRRVQAGELDLALVTMPGRLDRSLEATRLMQEPLLAYAPKAMLPPGAPVRAAQLMTVPLILYETGGATRQVIDAWFRRARLVPRPVMELGSAEAIRVLCESGLGATILPRGALGQETSGMALRPLAPAAARSLGLVARRDKIRDRGFRICQEELSAIALPV